MRALSELALRTASVLPRTCLLGLLYPTVAFAVEDPFSSPAYLKRLSIEQLDDIEITSILRTPQPLKLAASAVDIVRSDQIRRSGATNLPDILRLSTGLHVAQINGHTWAISARGFNGSVSNKMQLLMDGRSLYTPLYSGTFWDVQHTFLPDIEAVEVVRGPNATLWGANAVNGIINIRTKSAKDTLGVMIHGGGGLAERAFGGVRYGGRVGDTYYRAYVTGIARDNLRLQSGAALDEDYALLQGGFRVDSDLAPNETLTVQGDIYRGRFDQFATSETLAEGGNLLARWSHNLGAGSDIMVQAYYDRTHRFIADVYEEDRDTFDAELQHRHTFSAQHSTVWGLNYRASHDKIGNLGPGLAFLPDSETLHLAAGYLHHTYHAIPDRLSLMLGSRFEWNSFSGFEIQPTGRFSYRPADTHTLWGAVSRAVRTPSRIDQDYMTPNPATGQPTGLSGDRSFRSEVLLAYELGYRWEATRQLSFDLALFYHDYDRIRSVEPQGAGEPLRIANGLDADIYGASLGVRWEIAPWWKIKAGYSIRSIDIRPGRGSRDINEGRAEGNDPNHLLVVHSSMDLAANVEFDTIVRYVDTLPQPATPAYLALDLRLAWHATDDLELAIVGRNLLDSAHPEFSQGANTREVERSVYGTVTWRF